MNTRSIDIITKSWKFYLFNKMVVNNGESYFIMLLDIIDYQFFVIYYSPYSDMYTNYYI